MTNIDFVLEGLNNVINLTTLSTIQDGIDVSNIEADVNAIIDIKLTDMKKVFRFITDASDMDDINIDDTKYFVKMNNWPSNLILNPAHAILDISSNEYGTYENTRNMVKHDFVRHLANELFGSYKATELFTNQDYIKFDIAKKGHEISWLTIKEKLNSSYKSITQPFYTDTDTDISNNFTRDLLLQIINKNPERLQNISSIMNNDYLSIPFQDGDTINFKTVIYPNPLQKNLTGVNNISKRTYNIQLRAKEDIDFETVIPTDATFIRETNYNNSYNYNDGFEEFIMPIISRFDISSNDTSLLLFINANTFNRTSLKINIYNSEGDVVEIDNKKMENIFIDISEELLPAIITIIDTTTLDKSLTDYETEYGIYQYKFEFVTNDDLYGPVFDSYIYGNNNNNYELIN
jgi:hypothetical protein